MHPIHAGATAPKRVTAQHPFFSCSPNGAPLFSVRPNIPLDDAIDIASCFLASALDTVEQVAQNVGGDLIHGAVYLIEMSKAVVDSAAGSVMRQEGETRDDHLSFLREALADSQKQASQARTAKMRTYHDGRASAFQIAIAALEG